MTAGKRLFDLCCALLLALLLVPVMLCIALAILILDGRPVFYRAERMRAPGQAFAMLKFRTMRPVANDSGVSGGQKSWRITRTGHLLRPWRLDELPQLWNVLRGDMSFVGPRPPMREYVERYPELYSRVLMARPGITGLCTILMLRMEARLLRTACSLAEADAIYRRACLPRKARLDIDYQARRSMWFDVVLMLKTVLKLYPAAHYRLLGQPRAAMAGLRRKRLAMFAARIGTQQVG